MTASRTSQVHLTRRGRTLVLLALVAVLFAAFSLGRANTQAASAAAPVPPAAAPVFDQVTVQPGESLWSVARRVAPDHDPRELVAQIRRINDLASADLLVGQQLLLPTAA